VKENSLKLKYHKSTNSFHTIASFETKFEVSPEQYEKQLLESVEATLLSHITKYPPSGTLYIFSFDFPET
jgi:hypothetical protein